MPFAPACFPARETALWPLSANGRPAHRPVCQVSPPPYNLRKCLKNTWNYLITTATRHNFKVTLQWANRLISAVCTAAEFWHLRHRHMRKKRKKIQKQRSEWRTCQKRTGAAWDWSRFRSSEQRKTSLALWSLCAAPLPESGEIVSAVFQGFPLKSYAVNVEFWR